MNIELATIYRPMPGYDDLYAGMDASLVKAGTGPLEEAYVRPGTRHRQCPKRRRDRVREHTARQKQIIETNFAGVSYEQKRSMAKKLIAETSLSNREISRQSGVSHTTVAQFRSMAAPNKVG